jgi:hypothetical protein
MRDQSFTIAFVVSKACSVLPGMAVEGTASRDFLIHQQQSHGFYSSA